MKLFLTLFFSLIWLPPLCLANSEAPYQPVAEVCIGHFSHEATLDQRFQAQISLELEKRNFVVIPEIKESCQVTLSGDVYAELVGSKKGFYLFGRPTSALYTVKANLAQNTSGEILWQGEYGPPKFSFVAKKDQLNARAADLAKALKTFYQDKGRIAL